MLDIIRTSPHLAEWAEFLHLSKAGVFYLIIAFLGSACLYKRQTRLSKKLHEFDKELAAMETKKELNKVAYYQQEKRNDAILNHSLKSARIDRLHKWRR